MYWPGRKPASGSSPSGGQLEARHARALLNPTDDAGGAEHVARGHLRLGVQPVLEGDERAGHVPVDGVPRGGHVPGDHVGAEDLDDRGHQVLVDDPVLVLGDAEGDVLVPDPGQQRGGARPVRGDQQGRIGRDGGGERLLLGALGLVAAVEGVAQQLGVRGEHPPVEHRGDLLDVLTDEREGLPHDLLVSGFEPLLDVELRMEDRGGRHGHGRSFLDGDGAVGRLPSTACSSTLGAR